MALQPFPVVLRGPDEAGRIFVECPVLENCYSEGATREEALANIQEAITLCLEADPATKRKSFYPPEVTHVAVWVK